MTKENVLMISSDSSLLDESSRAFERHKRYAEYFNRLTVFVLNKEKNQISYKNLKIISLECEKTKDLFKMSKKLSDFCKQEKVDIMTTQNPFLTGLLGVYLKYKFKIPLNIQIHTECFSNLYYRRESLNNYLYYLLGMINCKFADSLRFVSKKELNFVKHLSKEHIFIPEDFNYFFQKKENKKNHQTLFVGRLSREKNLPLLIKAFKKLPEDCKKLKLKIVGEGEEENKLKSLIKKLNLTKKVRLLGKKSKKELKALLKNSDFLILPSFYEGWGLVCNEALASGLPVIMTNTGCASTLVINKKTGLVVPINNEIALTNTMKTLYKNDKLREKLGKNGQKLVKKKEFSQEYIEKKWINLLKNTTKLKNK